METQLDKQTNGHRFKCPRCKSKELVGTISLRNDFYLTTIFCKKCKYKNSFLGNKATQF
jgi:transcription elongation factor Elf1